MQTIKKEVMMVSCERCGNTWQPKVAKPVKCPKCGHRFDSKTTKKMMMNKKEAESYE